ncbi:MAG: HAD family hydrolase [Chloroflexota bacterium]
MSSKNIRDYKHIIWDWNGTLLDDAWLCLQTINRLLEARHLPPLSSERYASIFDFPVINYYRQAGFDFSNEPFEVVSTAFVKGYEAQRAECQLREGARSVLKRIQELGISQSILSASQQNSLETVVDNMDLSSFFVTLVGIGNHHAAGKLDAGQAWLNKVDLAPSDMVLIGDTTHDYEVGNALGVDCWLIPSGHQSRERLATCNTVLIDHLLDMLS